jgi:uracil-DNA glycosylase family 4
MTADRPESDAPRRVPRSTTPAFQDSDELQDAYLRRAIAEIGALNDEISASGDCADGTLPVMASGSPQADILMVKWAPSIPEQQEGVAFFGRAGSAILKSVQRLDIDPLSLYGTVCVKCLSEAAERSAEVSPPWLAREIEIVRPRLVVAMGERVVEAINRLELPLLEPIEATPGTIQTLTPTIEVVFTPDIDESLDEQSAKRAFWDAFRVLGRWFEAQPPY